MEDRGHLAPATTWVSRTRCRLPGPAAGACPISTTPELLCYWTAWSMTQKEGAKSFTSLGEEAPAGDCLLLGWVRVFPESELTVWSVARSWNQGTALRVWLKEGGQRPPRRPFNHQLFVQCLPGARHCYRYSRHSRTQNSIDSLLPCTLIL